MDEGQFALARDCVTYLFEGAWLRGVTFGAILQINFHAASHERGHIDSYINVNSGWAVVASATSKWPVFEEEPPGLPIGEQLALLYSLKEVDIVKVELLREPSHLTLHFADGRVLLISGYPLDVEVWEAGGRSSKYIGPGNFVLIALADGDFATWCPEAFLEQWKQENPELAAGFGRKTE